MATTPITLNIDATVLNRVIAGLCGAGGYQALLADGSPNPQTPAQFAKHMIVAYVRTTILNFEQQQAAVAASQPVQIIDAALIT